MSDDNSEVKDLHSLKVARRPVDLQRMKLEKLMKNPEKPAFIPDITREKKFPDAPEFVRNVMGSSAGAGSGEFHVYRHIRRREYARNIYLQKSKEKQILDEEFQQKMDELKNKAAGKTAKKRAKRQRMKMMKRLKKLNKEDEKKNKESDSEESEDEEMSEKSEDEEKLDKSDEERSELLDGKETSEEVTKNDNELTRKFDVKSLEKLSDEESKSSNEESKKIDEEPMEIIKESSEKSDSEERSKEFNDSDNKVHENR